MTLSGDRSAFTRLPTPSPGPELALLLLGGFRAMVDATTAELARRGHPDVRATHEFAMRAIAGGAGSAVELARRLAVSKQAAAKTIFVLEARGYVVRESDAGDGWRRPLVLTPRGRDMLEQGQAVLDAIRRGWIERVGADTLMTLESALRLLVADGVAAPDVAAWLNSA